MKYGRLRKREMAMVVVVFCMVIVGCAYGAQRVAVSAMASRKTLPIYSVETRGEEKLVALGINCAWGDGDIGQILDTLDEQEIKATFFMVGSFCEEHEQAVLEIHNRGHEIGNHSDTHADMPTLSKDEMRREIEDCSDKIEKITGERPTLFRAPSGAYNDEVIEVANSQGYFPIQWSLDSLDWKGKTGAEMEERILPKLTYGDILLFHNDTDFTSQALGDIIAKIKANGYEFKTVGEMIYKSGYEIDVTGRQYPV